MKHAEDIYSQIKCSHSFIVNHVIRVFSDNQKERIRCGSLARAANQLPVHHLVSHGLSVHNYRTGKEIDAFMEIGAKELHTCFKTDT